MDVAAGRDVEIVLGNFFAADDAAVFFLFPPRFESFGDAQDRVVGQVVFRVALGELAAGVEQKDFALSFVRLRLVEHENNARRGGVVEKIFWQVDHAFDQVLLDEPSANFFFFVRVRVARASGGGAGIEDDGGTAFGIQAGQRDLDPAPVCFAAGIARSPEETLDSSAS